jgi:hypothetical protein
MGIESHYHSKKDRIFVRAIQGHYNLKEELQRLRSLPRVKKGSELKFMDGPSATAGTTWSRWTASARRCTSTSRNTARAACRRSTAT